MEQPVEKEVRGKHAEGIVEWPISRSQQFEIRNTSVKVSAPEVARSRKRRSKRSRDFGTDNAVPRRRRAN